MKIHKFFLLIFVNLLCSTVNIYAYTPSIFEFVFKNKTNDNIVTPKKKTNPSGSGLINVTGPANMKPNETRHFFLLQNPRPNFMQNRKPPRILTIKMSWLLTVANKKGKTICQNRVLGWVKGKTSRVYSTDYRSYDWRYNIISIQSSPDIKMCPFHGMFPQYLPSSYKENSYKYYSLVIKVNKDNSITVG